MDTQVKHNKLSATHIEVKHSHTEGSGIIQITAPPYEPVEALDWIIAQFERLGVHVSAPDAQDMAKALDYAHDLSYSMNLEAAHVKFTMTIGDHNEDAESTLAIPYPDDEENDDGDDEDDDDMYAHLTEGEPDTDDSADQFSDWDDESNRLNIIPF